MGYAIETTELYQTWLAEQTPKMQGQIVKRLAKIENDEHFGTWKKLGDSLAEIKFNNGIRIYFMIKNVNGKTILLLMGGNKNGQSKDIAKAKSLLA